MLGRTICAVFVALVTTLSVRGQADAPTVTTGDILQHPSRITIVGHFEVPSSSTSVLELAERSIAAQIDQKRAADAANAQTHPIWSLAIWRYFPANPGGTLNSPVVKDDDPFFTPEYLKVRGRQLDYETRVSDKASLRFFGH
jgi:hypothetical protein